MRVEYRSVLYVVMNRISIAAQDPLANARALVERTQKFGRNGVRAVLCREYNLRTPDLVESK